MKTVNGSSTIKSIIERYPVVKDVFAANGLSDLLEDEKLNKVGAFLTIKSALKAKNKDLHVFLQMLSERINSSGDGIDVTLVEKDSAQMTIIGHVPLPVRIQVLEAFEDFRVQLHEHEGFTLAGELAAGQEGIGLINEICKYKGDPRLLPDIIFAEGFNCLFGQPFRELFVDSDFFGRALPWDKKNIFEEIGLQDPQDNYNILGIIPAVFIVDRKALNGRPEPRTWKDLLNWEYEKLIVMSSRNVAVYKSVILTLYAQFGEEGVRTLARNTSLQLHPSEIIKLFGSNKKERPAISILPWFFSEMVEQTEDISVIWPEDGAIVAPIFMLVKSDPEFYKTDPKNVEYGSSFFSSRQMGEILAKGCFPSLYSGIDNGLPDEASFQWVGWDFLSKMDSGSIIPQVYDLFDAEMGSR